MYSRFSALHGGISGTPSTLLSAGFGSLKYKTLNYFLLLIFFYIYIYIICVKMMRSIGAKTSIPARTTKFSYLLQYFNLIFINTLKMMNMNFCMSFNIF
jgi:hypothetical protein